MTSTGFLEVRRSFDAPKQTIMLGNALQFDDFKNELNASFDQRWLTPCLFATVERALGPLTI